jgi:hypothetical protein
VASTFYSTLEPVSFKLSSALTVEQRAELAVEVQFYSLLRLMMPTEVPYYAQEQMGVALLKRAQRRHRACAGVGVAHRRVPGPAVRQYRKFVQRRTGVGG